MDSVTLSLPIVFKACITSSVIYERPVISLFVLCLNFMVILSHANSLQGPSLTQVHVVGTWVERPSRFKAVLSEGEIVQPKLLAIVQATLLGSGAIYSFKKELYLGFSQMPFNILLRFPFSICLLRFLLIVSASVISAKSELMNIVPSTAFKIRSWIRWHMYQP